MPDPHAHYGREYMYKSIPYKEKFEFVEPETDEGIELDLPKDAHEDFW